MKLFLYAGLFLFALNTEAFAKNCEEVRMGLDIGSGSTKILVAKVDFCHNKILESLYNESLPVGYNEDLEKNNNGNLSPTVIEKGLATLTAMVNKGRTFKPKKSFGVATSVFRKAENGPDVIKGFSRKLNIRMEVISQEEEARLGYLAIMATMDDKDSKDILIWDIGGGSMQMFSLDKNKRSHNYLGNLASVSFKNMVIEVLESKDLESSSSPNPVGDKRIQAIALARSYSKLHVPLDIKMMMKDKIVIGVGGVHGQSIKNQLQLKESKYTLEELDKVSKVQAQKSDKELTGDYRSTDVTNLLLVQGFMEGLGIKEVRLGNAGLVQGAILR